MSRDFIDELMDALNRVVTPDAAPLKEVLILSGMPEETQNLRYLSFNRQVVEDGDRTFEFSGVAVLNNRRAASWRLEGLQKKISRIIFSTRWTFNPLDLFLNNLRCNPAMMDILAGAAGNYTLMGLIQTGKVYGTGFYQHEFLNIHPVIAVPGIDDASLKTVADFEEANIIRKITIKGITLYRKIGRFVPA